MGLPIRRRWRLRWGLHYRLILRIGKLVRRIWISVWSIGGKIYQRKVIQLVEREMFVGEDP
jgi:hypothetical protein